MRPTQAIIDVESIKHNIKLAANLSGGKVMTIVKADAYGFGLQRLIEDIHNLYECASFGVAFGDEGAALREKLNFLASKKDVITLEGFFNPQDLEQHFKYDLTPTIHHVQQMEMLKECKPDKQLKVWLKYNSGMNRLGLNANELGDAYKWIAEQDPNIIKLEGIMTHFSSANLSDNTVSLAQIADFSRALEPISKLIDIVDIETSLAPKISLCNSPGIVSGFGQAPFSDSNLPIKSWALNAEYISRPGLMLYGASPMDDMDTNEIKIKTSMRLTTHLIAVRHLKQGDEVGYERGWCAGKDCLMGVAPIGYADGYPFVETKRVALVPVMVKGQRCSLGGRVSMDMLCLDLSNCPDAKVGDEVELWGDNISANEVAQLITCPVQKIFASLTKRVPRIYQ